MLLKELCQQRGPAGKTTGLPDSCSLPLLSSITPCLLLVFSIGQAHLEAR